MQKVLDNIENIVEVGGNFRMIVTGYSMLPLLGYGHDHIIVRRTDLSEPIHGRIAMFRTPNRRIIVQRVIEIDGDKFSIASTSGFSLFPKNCLAYADKDST